MLSATQWRALRLFRERKWVEVREIPAQTVEELIQFGFVRRRVFDIRVGQPIVITLSGYRHYEKS